MIKTNLIWMCETLNIYYIISVCKKTSRFGSFSQASPRAKQNLSDCVFSWPVEDNRKLFSTCTHKHKHKQAVWWQ